LKGILRTERIQEYVAVTLQDPVPYLFGDSGNILGISIEQCRRGDINRVIYDGEKAMLAIWWYY